MGGQGQRPGQCYGIPGKGNRATGWDREGTPGQNYRMELALSRLQQPKARSYSQLNTWTECSYKYYLERVRQVPAPQAVWFPAGTAYHSATEWFDREMFAGHPILLEAGRQKLAQVWAAEYSAEIERAREKEPDLSKWFTAGRPSKDKPHGEDVEWWRNAGADMVQRYADWWEAGPRWQVAALPDGAPALEVPVLCNLNGVPVRGFVDMVLESKDSKGFLVVDKKTGSRVPQHPLQLATYAVELSEMLGLPVTWGSYFMARTAELTEPRSLAYLTPELLAQMYQRMDEAERRGLYLPNLDQHCARCLVRRFCPAAGGTEYAVRTEYVEAA